MYPQKYGNGWDSSLKVLPYFELRKELSDFIMSEKIQPEEVGALYPIIQNTKFTELSTENFSFVDLDKVEMQKCKYVIVSNIYNTMKLDEFEKVKREWELLKVFRKGGVEVGVFKSSPQ